MRPADFGDEIRASVSRGERFALAVLSLGTIAIVLAASPNGAFDLDRFLVPKELVLHLTALLAGLFAGRRAGITRIDLALLAFLALSAASAALATNGWLAFRALAITASGIVLFRVARSLRAAGLERPLLIALACAVVLAAITSLAQTYGLWIPLFTESRAPGGTLGNRNFVAHAAAFGLPLLLAVALRARRGFVIGALGVALVTASLVLTRSRAAWLAAATVVVLVVVAMLLAAPLRRDSRSWRRLAAIAMFAVLATAAAILLPNTLRWRSDNPYLDSVKDVANYEEGSGRGRLIQYERSLRMAAGHPLLGVGPGNWPVEYPRQAAARRDPSLDPSEPGRTFNPWPSSDWVAFVSERGFAAAVLLALALLGLAITALRQLRTAIDANEALLAVALLGTLAAAGVTGAFDAVLLLPLPAFLVWSILGVLTPSGAASEPSIAGVRSVRRSTVASAALVLTVIIAAAGLARSAAQLAAMELYATGDRTSLRQAARLDPGSYRLRVRLARSGNRAERCRHALAAHALFPASEEARALRRGCK